MKQIIAWAIFCSCFVPAWSQSDTQAKAGTEEKRELIDWDGVRDEKLNLHRSVKEKEIDQVENRMVRHEVDLANLRKEEALEVTIQRTEIDLEIDALRKEDLQLDLDQINTRLKDGSVPVEDKKAAYARQSEIEGEIDALKVKDRSLRFTEKEMLRTEQMNQMSRTQLKAEIIEMKMERKRLDIMVDQRGHVMTQAERSEMRLRIKDLTRSIKRFESRYEALRG